MRALKGDSEGEGYPGRGRGRGRRRRYGNHSSTSKATWQCCGHSLALLAYRYPVGRGPVLPGRSTGNARSHKQVQLHDPPPNHAKFYLLPRSQFGTGPPPHACSPPHHWPSSCRLGSHPSTVVVLRLFLGVTCLAITVGTGDTSGSTPPHHCISGSTPPHHCTSLYTSSGADMGSGCAMGAPGANPCPPPRAVTSCIAARVALVPCMGIPPINDQRPGAWPTGSISMASMAGEVDASL